MWRHSYNEDWERKKSYLIRSLFHDVVPLLSPVPEEPDDSSDAPRRPPSPLAYRPYSPLPPLIIEREPNRHDEPDEYYRVLAVKIRRIYKKMLIAGRRVSDSDLIDDFDVNNDLNVTNDSVNDSNHVSINGYSADYESYESEVASDLGERSERNDNQFERDESNDHHIERDESNDSTSDVNKDTHENKSSESHSGGTDNEVYDEHSEVIKEMIVETVHEELAEEVGSDNTEDKSGSDYRQITTEAQIHADGNQVETQSYIYEGSERSVILTSRPLHRGEAELGQEREGGEVEESEESMADEETVILEDNEDPKDVHMTNKEPVEDTEAEMSDNIEDIEVMRTPLPKTSVESMAHAAHRPSVVSTDLNIMHHASLMTSDTDASRTMSPNLNEDEDYVTRRRRKSMDTIDTDVLSHVSPILNVPSNVQRTSIEIEEQVTSDMDITCPISNFNEPFIKTTEFNRGSEKIPPETNVVAPRLNVESLNEEYKENLDEHTQRVPREITSDSEVLRYEESVNEDTALDVDRVRERMSGTSTLKENRGRKRRAEDVGVQAVVQRVGWDDLKMNFFVGTPKIYKLCYCSDHVCS